MSSIGRVGSVRQATVGALAAALTTSALCSVASGSPSTGAVSWSWTSPATAYCRPSGPVTYSKVGPPVAYGAAAATCDCSWARTLRSSVARRSTSRCCSAVSSLAGPCSTAHMVRDGIVKLTKRSSIDPKYTGLQPVANPPCWASETAVSLNLTIPRDPLELVVGCERRERPNRAPGAGLVVRGRPPDIHRGGPPRAQS